MVSQDRALQRTELFRGASGEAIAAADTISKAASTVAPELANLIFMGISLRPDWLMIVRCLVFREIRDVAPLGSAATH